MTRPIFSNFPILETPRLLLRDIRPTDQKSIYAIYSDPKVALYDCFTPITTLETADQIIKRYCSDYWNQEEIRWGIVLKENDCLIGTCGLGNCEPESKRCEIGYDLMYEHWNKGYMTEALGGIITFGFEQMGLNRIEAFVTPGNAASIRVLQKLHFIKEGLVRERDFFKGKFHDGIILAILKRDFVKYQAILAHNLIAP